MTASAADSVVIELATHSESDTSTITLRHDGTAELRDGSGVLRHQNVKVIEVDELLQRMLNLGFFEMHDVFDRGMTRHPQSYRLTLRHAGREHSAGFDDHQFSGDLQSLAAGVRSIGHFAFWEPKLLPDTTAQ